MQFFYIDYIKDGKKERNIGFLRVEQDGINVGLRSVPVQCGDSCKVYVINVYGETILLGEIEIRNGYGMKKFRWERGVRFEECMQIEVPLYGSRKGVCILREKTSSLPVASKQKQEKKEEYMQSSSVSKVQEVQREKTDIRAARGGKEILCEDLYDEIHEDKWQQLLAIYPQVHICPEAQSILIRPKDVVVLTGRYHGLATNSFVLHAYYNYRQLLLFRYMQDTMDEVQGQKSSRKQEQAAAPQYYLGVPGVFYEREQRIAQLFGFEGFENGEARMQQDADKKLYRGCFGYYMKRVEI